MPNNASVKKSLQPNKQAFSELDDSLFVEIELREEEKASGGGVGRSPFQEITTTTKPQTGHLVWATSFIF